MTDAQKPSTTSPISLSAVTAVILGVAALLLLGVSAGMGPIALILALAAILLGIVAAINARRQSNAGAWLGYVGAGIGTVAAIMILLGILFAG